MGVALTDRERTRHRRSTSTCCALRVRDAPPPSLPLPCVPTLCREVPTRGANASAASDSDHIAPSGRDLSKIELAALTPLRYSPENAYPRRAVSPPGWDFCTKRRAYLEKQRGNHPKTRGFCTTRPKCAQFNKKHGFRKKPEVVMADRCADRHAKLGAVWVPIAHTVASTDEC